jgi:hypothetical protein
MLTDFQQLYKRVSDDFKETYALLSALGKRCEHLNDMQELADGALACREVYRLADDTRKEVDKLRKLCERMACLLWVKDSDGEPIRTRFCTATPDVKIIASIPKRTTRPDDYARLMTHLGIPVEMWDRDIEVVRPHWPGFVDYISKLTAQGLPMPPGIDPDRTYPEYHLRTRRTRDVDDGYEPEGNIVAALEDESGPVDWLVLWQATRVRPVDGEWYVANVCPCCDSPLYDPESDVCLECGEEASHILDEYELVDWLYDNQERTSSYRLTMYGEVFGAPPGIIAKLTDMRDERRAARPA